MNMHDQNVKKMDFACSSAYKANENKCLRNFFLFLIFIRASLDYFNEISIIGVNPASIVAIFIIAVCFCEILLARVQITTGHNAVLIGYFIYFICILPSIIVSNSLSTSLEEILKYLCALSCIYLCVIYTKRDTKFVFKLLNIMLLSALIPLIVGTYQLIMQDGMYDKDVGAQRVFSVFTHPNQYAIYLVVIATITFLFLFNVIPSSKRYKIFVGLILVAVLVNLLFTYSRTCWVWLSIIVAGIILFNIKKKSILLICIILFIASFFVTDIIIERFVDVSSAGDGGSLNIRNYIIEALMPYAMEEPLFGHGLGTFDFWSGLIINNTIQAHNEYFKTLFESGFIGLIGLVIFFACSLISAIKQGLRRNYIVIFFLLGYFVTCYFTNTLSSLVGQIYLVSLLATMVQYNKNEAGKDKI